MTSGPVTPGRVLVVDDNEMNRDVLSRRVARCGHAVETAASGPEALARAAAAAYDVILLDLMMPGMDGYEVLARLKADPALEPVRVIVVTALEDADSVVRCLALGADDHLPKPFNPAVLEARLASSLARKRLRDAERRHARAMERELEIGREIQAGFLPDRLPEVPGWELAARLRPARQVGGDFYDAFVAGAPAAPRIAVVIADVCGKGVGAALFTGLFRSLLRVAADPYWVTPVRDDAAALVRAVRRVNEYIAVTHDRANMFATLFFGLLEPGSGRLTYVNGGHDPPLLLGADGVVERLDPTGPAVGMLPEVEFATRAVTIVRGQALLVYTDGVLDARDAAGAQFGEQSLLELAAAAGREGLGAEPLVARVDAAVAAFAAGAEQADDLTLLALRRP